MCKKKVRKEYQFTAEEYTYMAKGYFESGDHSKAISCLESAEALFLRDKKGSKKKAEWALCNQLYGSIVAKKGWEKESLKAFNKALSLYRKNKNIVKYADCLVDKSIALENFMQEKQAIRLRKKALRELNKKEGAEQERAKANYFLGAVYYKKKDPGYDHLAEKYFFEAMKQPSPPEYLFFALGSIEMRLKNYRKALDFLLQSQRLREEMYCDTPYHPLLEEIYIILGDVYTMINLHAKAIKFYIRALNICEVNKRFQPAPEYKELLLKMQYAYDNAGEPDKAEKYKILWENE